MHDVVVVAEAGECQQDYAVFGKVCWSVLEESVDEFVSMFPSYKVDLCFFCLVIGEVWGVEEYCVEESAPYLLFEWAEEVSFDPAYFLVVVFFAVCERFGVDVYCPDVFDVFLVVGGDRLDAAARAHV